MVNGCKLRTSAQARKECEYMKKIILVNEMVLHQHAIEVEIDNEDDLEQILEDLDGERCDSADDAFIILGEMHNVEILNINREYSVEVDSIEYDCKNTENE